MLEEILIEKVLDKALGYAKKIFRESGTKLRATKDEIEESIVHHIRSVNTWSAEVSFYGLKKAKDTTDIFIELDLFVYPRRMRIDSQERIKSIPLKNIFDDSNHVILLGQPGAGKTTSMKYLCQLLFQDDKFQAERFAFPILIKFRELNSFRTSSESIIIDQICSILGLDLIPAKKTDNADPSELRAARERLAISFLNNLNVLLILDGFDELTQVKYREDAIRDLRKLSVQLKTATFILTSRTGDFVYSINNTAQFEICSLNKDQITTFAIKWLKDKKAANDFLRRIYDSPFADTAIRPLTLAHLCAIYERVGKIPDKPKSIYRRIVNLLLEEWDRERSVKRESGYAKFELDRKFEFLCHLAYSLTMTWQKTVFSKEDLLRVYYEIYQDYDLIRNEAQQVVNELESHTGLFLQTGYEEFEFAHKSLQEYLAAEHIVKLPSMPSDISVISKIPNELAIAVAISSRPSDYLSEMLFSKLLRMPSSKDFLKSFLNRLLLEKPDFNSGVKIGLALIVLHSMYIRNNVSQGYIRDLESFNREYESMMKAATRKEAIDIIKKGYVKFEEHSMKSGDAIYHMVKRSRLNNRLLEDLPPSIFIRNSMLKIAVDS